MDTRNELRGFLKQSQKTSEIADATLPSNLNSTGRETVKDSETSGRNNEIRVRTKRSSHSRKERVNENMEHKDEVVKYMSKLPDYLQRIERREESFQSNVLNVGVLDWGRLEKWKNGGARDCSNSLSRDGERSGRSDRKIDDQVHSCSNLCKCKASRDLQRDSLNKKEGVNLGKSRRSRSYQESTSGLLSEMGNLGLRDKKTEKRAGEKINGDSKADLTSVKQENQQVSNHLVDFSDRILGLGSQIPRSCPLSFDLERDSEDMMLPIEVDISGKKERFGGRRQSKTASRIFDQEMSEYDESRKNRHPSPNKRFSFSFGRLSRSFTLKEDTAGQPDDTIKSDSMRFVASVQSSSNPAKQNIHGGSRVSPLRRLLLDPLLKSTGSENVPPSKSRSSFSNPNPTNIDTSITRSLFQLTIRNGIPLFQFVVDYNDNSSSRSILGATMKNSASSFKDDSVQYCTFYSVNEVKKKKSRSWLTHGFNEKQRGFVYNVIGQMRLCNSINDQKSGNNSSVIRESVLFDESDQVKERKEVAAVVIKRCEENYSSLEETSVIIAGGVHSFPEKGAPSPLISRWRSGGVCDCGGWDVGCKLHVFSNKKVLHEFDQSFKLFDQEESEQDSGLALAMTELKRGIFRVEFGSSLSPLQAFFVCVTVITCASKEETVSKTTGKSSSPFAPPLSPVGRV